MFFKRYLYISILTSLFSLIIISCGKNYKFNEESLKPTTNFTIQKNANFIKITDITYHYSEDKWYINVGLKNESNEYIAINSIISGCDCIEAVYTKRPIKHLEKAKLRIIYTPISKDSHFIKLMMIVFNNGEFYKILKLNNLNYHSMR